MGFSYEMSDPFLYNQSGFRSTDILLMAHTTSLAFFDFCAILLNILLLLAMKKSAFNITEKLQITKTILLVLSGAICIPLDIAATSNSSLMINVGKGSAEDVLLYTSPALFLAIAFVRLRVMRSTFNPQVIDSAYAPVLLTICLIPTLVCIITRLPWHFSFTTSELQTKGDIYFDVCSVFVTSMLPIAVGIYIYWRICRKLTEQRLGEHARPATRSPSAIFAIHMMKETMMKSIMYACVTTAVTWLLLIVAKLCSILLSLHVQWVLAYFKVLIIFTNPLCEGICMSSKKENIALLYRRHFKFNRVNIGNPKSAAFNTDMEMIHVRKPQLSLSVVDEEEEKSSPATCKSEETNNSQTEGTVVKPVSYTPGQDLAVCSLPETCACSACMTGQLLSRLQQSRSPSLPHSSKQTDKEESISETVKTEVTASSFNACDTGILPVCLSRHNSDGTCRIGQLSPATIKTKIAEVRRMRSEISLSPGRSIFFPDEHVRLSPSPHSSYKPYNLDRQTRMLTGIAMDKLGEKCYTQQGDKGREATTSSVSDIASFHSRPLSRSHHSEDTIFSSGINEDSQEKTKQSSAKTSFPYRPRRSLNSSHVPGNAYPATRLNRMNTFNEGTAQSDGKSSCGSLEFQYARRGHSRRGSRLSKQGSVYSISSFCPSLKSVTSVTCSAGYADLFESELFHNCQSNTSTTSLESQKKLLSSLSDFF